MTPASPEGEPIPEAPAATPEAPPSTPVTESTGPGRFARLRRLLPYFTLGWALTSATLMKRTPERAWLVAVSVAAGWLFLAGAVVLARRRSAAAEIGLRHRVVTFGATAATQSLMQLTLFFVLPFYWLSAAPLLPHWLFLVFAALVAGLTLWDPLFNRVFRVPAAAVALKGATSFVGLAAALPFLGLSHAMSLWMAALGSAAGVPLVALATAAPADRARALRAAAIVAALLPLGVFLGAARWMPPAPLRLIESGLGTDVNRSTRTLVGQATAFPRGTDRLHCFTAIYAPLGLREAIFHVWTRNDAPLYRATLDVGGNRKGAWRTWSNVNASRPGHYRCEVVTSTGQLLGRLDAAVGP